jgi:type 1 glutamine amidotransferase
MNPRILTVALALIAALPAAARAERADAQQAPKRVLFFTKSAGYEHSVIRDPSLPFKPSPGSEVPGLAFQVLRALGARENIDFVFSKDGSLFSPAYLAQFDAYFFFTTGDLTKVGNDGNPAMSPEGKEALLQAVAGGKGFIGTHSATDTFHSAGVAGQGDGRYRNDGESADPYVKMIGGEFVIHGSQQPSHLIVADPAFPGASAVGPDSRFKEEWYSLKNFAPDMHVILVQDTAGMVGNPYARPSYPSTWARMYGRGRVFYTNMGHRDDVWNSALFQSVVAGGLNWTLGRVDADVSPNLNAAAPGANTLPPPEPPKK